MCEIKENSDRQEKRRETPGNFTSASLYCFNVNRTSQDHLLLGGNADVDKNVEWPEYTSGSERCQDRSFLKLWVWARESQLSLSWLIVKVEGVRRKPPDIERSSPVLVLLP
jgi:hypothetical protein